MVIARASCLRILGATGLAVVVVVGCESPSFAATATRHHARRDSVPTDLGPSFQKFCASWMEKVWARESAHVQENASDPVARGSYVEYSRQYGCELVRQHPPVGKINYREFRHAKGDGPAEHNDAARQPLEVFDSDEYFTYLHGKWQ